MLIIKQKAQCVLWYHKLKSPTAVQHKVRNEFGQDPSHTNSIKRWFKNFMKIGSTLDHMFYTLLQTYAFIKNDLFLLILTIK